jgi:hypothetical protein
VIHALTQGIGDTSTPASRAALISTYQGSEIPGVPASLMRAIFFQALSSSIIFSIFVTPE